MIVLLLENGTDIDKRWIIEGIDCTQDILLSVSKAIPTLLYFHFYFSWGGVRRLVSLHGCEGGGFRLLKNDSHMYIRYGELWPHPIHN